MKERRYKVVVTMENSVATYRVIYTASGAEISTHKNKAEAKAAIFRYEAADARRASDSYSGDTS
jgi:hypothetical protein